MAVFYKGKQELIATYRYDAMNRLTGEDRGGTGERYAYDLCGNRLKKQSFHVLSGDTVIDSEESYCYNESSNVSVTADISLWESRISCFCCISHSMPYVAGANLTTLRTEPVRILCE